MIHLQAEPTCVPTTSESDCTLDRPIQKLYPLELKLEQEHPENFPITFVKHGLKEN
jgi:hypothetical protein